MFKRENIAQIDYNLFVHELLCRFIKKDLIRPIKTNVIYQRKYKLTNETDGTPNAKV